MTITSTLETPKRVVLHPQVAARIAEIVPPYMDFTTFVNHALTGLVDNLTPSPLTIPPSTPTKINPVVDVSGVEGGVSSERQRATNEGGEGEISLRAEEAHVEPEVLESVRAPAGLKRHQVARSIDPAYQSLQCHADLIQEFWRAKSGKRSDRAWVTLLNGLTAIQAAYGDRVVREQLELAAANGWSSITLANYEKFGLPRGNAPTQANDSSRFAHLTGMSI